MTASARRCSVLLIKPVELPSPDRGKLEALGFQVTEVREWPEGDRAILDFHVVILPVQKMESAGMLAARVRAKPRFGRRVLIAIVPASTTDRERLAARTSGFDDVLNDGCDERLLASRILKHLRARPELDCLLRPVKRRRFVA